MLIVLYIGYTLPVFGIILVIIGKTRKDIDGCLVDLEITCHNISNLKISNLYPKVNAPTT